MSVRIVLLCEDAATDTFVRRFLRRRQFKARDIKHCLFHMAPNPASNGFEKSTQTN